MPAQEGHPQGVPLQDAVLLFLAGDDLLVDGLGPAALGFGPQRLLDLTPGLARSA